MSKKKNKNKSGSKIGETLSKSPINYFSDLFIVAMVLGWIFVLLVMIGFAAYATVHYEDVSMWSEIANLVAIPLSAGGAIWMIKNSVQHAIANNQGKQAKEDFPKVNADGEDEGFEQTFEQAQNEDFEFEDEDEGEGAEREDAEDDVFELENSDAEDTVDDEDPVDNAAG